MWKPRSGQRLWAATSRALRTPSLTDQGIRLVYPPVPTDSGLPLIVTLRGNPAAETETLVDAEAGYRVEIGTAASIDVTGFVGRYDHLRTQEPSAPVVQFVPSPRILGCDAVRQPAGGDDQGARSRGPLGAGLGLAPRRQLHDLPSHAAPGRGKPGSVGRVRRTAARPSAMAAALGAVPGQLARPSASPSSMSVRSSSSRWPPTRAPTSARNGGSTSGLSAMVIGQNLFDAAHAEFGGAGTLLLATQVPRSVSLQLRWTSR